MFNSRRINNDPEPCVGWSGKRYEDSTYPSLEDGPVSNEPRPEYDNNPNPLLEAFRDFLEIVGHDELVEKAKNVLANDLVWDKEVNDVQYIDHARRVLEKLVSVYG